ncbi:hypothetical protein [Agromyces ramosus]|nr:hypothetical protein [Agromyces ramosus]
MPDARPRRLTPRVAALLGSAGVLAVVLSGCSGAPAPTPSPPASASAAPIFASDEEALAAAEAAYSRYLDAVDELTQDGGEDPTRVKSVVSEAYASELMESLAVFKSSGNHTVGYTTYDSMVLGERSEAGGSAAVTTYVCLDVGDVRVVDSSGVDVTPPGRRSRTPIQAQFVSSPNDPSELLPSGSESWPGDDFC